MITHTISSLSTFGPSGGTLSGSVTETGTVEHLLDESFIAETADELVSISFAYAGVKAIWLLASTDLTLNTNLSTGTDVIELKAGIPFAWTATCNYFPNPFTVDVTAFYFDCDLACRLQGVILTA